MRTMFGIAESVMDLTALGRGEHLLVSAWRKIGVGQNDCPLVAREFWDHCGADACQVQATLFTFLRALAYAGRRRFRVGHPGWPYLTGDERQLLTLIAAVQVDEDVHLDAHLRWLVRNELRPAFVIATRALGAALDDHHLRLSLPALGGLSVGQMGMRSISV